MPKVVTGEVRFSYAYVFEPKQAETEGQKDKYEICLLIPKTDKKTIKRIKGAIDEALQNGKSNFKKGSIPKKWRNPLRDGDEDREDDESFEGMYFINAKSIRRPGIIDKAGNPIIDTEKFYSGCYGHASIDFFAYNEERGKGTPGVSCGLNNLMKTKDGERFGAGAASAENDFSDLIDTSGYSDDDDDLM